MLTPGRQPQTWSSRWARAVSPQQEASPRARGWRDGTSDLLRGCYGTGDGRDSTGQQHRHRRKYKYARGEGRASAEAGERDLRRQVRRGTREAAGPGWEQVLLSPSGGFSWLRPGTVQRPWCLLSQPGEQRALGCWLRLGVWGLLLSSPSQHKQSGRTHRPNRSYLFGSQSCEMQQ